MQKTAQRPAGALRNFLHKLEGFFDALKNAENYSSLGVGAA